MVPAPAQAPIIIREAAPAPVQAPIIIRESIDPKTNQPIYVQLGASSQTETVPVFENTDEEKVEMKTEIKQISEEKLATDEPVIDLPKMPRLKDSEVAIPVGVNSVSQPYFKEVVDTSAFIIMQHPIQRDLVRCSVSDDVCLRAYERLGYERADNISELAKNLENPDCPEESQAKNW